MEFINGGKFGFDWESYSNYLNSIKDRLPGNVFLFASDLKHYDGDSRSSLHDAWLDYFNVFENANGERMENRSTEIEARFLGPYHDRRIFLRYMDVLGYEMKSDELARGHGDLLLHEVRIGEDSEIIHELKFVNERTLIVQCRDLIHWEEPYNYNR